MVRMGESLLARRKAPLTSLEPGRLGHDLCEWYLEETVARGILTGGTKEKIPKLDIKNESSWELSQTFQTIGPDLLVGHEISFVDQELFYFFFM